MTQEKNIIIKINGNSNNRIKEPQISSFEFQVLVNQ